METPPDSEPTTEELTSQQLMDFVVSGAPISQRAAGHLKALSPEEREAFANGLEFEDGVSPERRQWLVSMSKRGAALIDLMAEPKTAMRTQAAIKRKGMGRT